MTFLVALAIGTLVVYTGVVLLLWKFQERVVFQPPAVSSQTPAQTHRVSFQTADGVDLIAHVVGECSPGTTVVLAFHGNAEVAWWRAAWAIELARAAGVCVVLAEYRGYDGLGGIPTYETSALDAQAALQHVHDVMGVASDDVVYFGHSLGSAIAAELAAHEPPRALVLQAPFSSATAMSRRYLVGAPSFLLTRIARVRFDTVACVSALPRPVWVAHGHRDIVVPVRMGEAVFEAARMKGELLLLPHGGHNDVPDVGGRAYVDWLVRAIDDTRGVRSTPAAPGETRLAP